MNVFELEQKTQQIKLQCLKMCIGAGQGHVTSAFSCAEIMVALYYDIMRYDVKNPKWSERDRFVMSKNHASVILYPILQDVGFVEKDKEICFMENGSKYGGHSKAGVPGVEFSGGSLGIGLGVACGMAYDAKMKKASHRVFAVVGDGECYEGSIWESIMFAAHNELSNLVMFIDRNQMAITDYTENMLKLDSMKEKLLAFHWDVEEIDGHDIQQIISAVNAERASNKPRCIICNTIKGNGISSMSNKMFKHGVAPRGQEAKLAIAEIEGKIVNGI